MHNKNCSCAATIQCAREHFSYCAAAQLRGNIVLKTVGWDYVDLTYLAEDRDKLLAFVNTVMNL
jgi:hypothetical protein